MTVMAKQCEICGKGTTFGRNVSHAHNVTSRTWEPNLQRVRAVIDGGVRRVRVCTRCLRSGKIVKAPPRKWPPESEAAKSCPSPPPASPLLFPPFPLIPFRPLLPTG